MEKKQYWQNFGEFTNSNASQEKGQDEFGSDALPFEDLSGKGVLDSPTPRRDFLKYLGFSTAAAMAAASCEMPVRHSIPFVNRPQDIVPGEANYYATTYVAGGEVIPVVAKVRDGRPIKLEGNAELKTYTNGGTSARMQASVLDLYDTARQKYPTASNKEVSSFDALDKMIAGELTGPVVILTGSNSSPSTKAVIDEFIAKFPGSRHVKYDAISYSGILLANEASYGRRVIPSYKFGNAEVIVSLGADFLGTWLSPVEFQNDYTTRRKINEKNISMSKHYQLESFMSMTGANADERYTHRPSETGAVAVALLNALNGQALPSLGSPNLVAGIKKIAQELNANKGKSLVVSGSNNPSVQIIVNAINEAIGANGTTVDWAAPLLTWQAVDTDMAALIADINAGRVNSLFLYDVNPVYDYYNAEAFKSALSKVRLTVAFSQKMDETAEYCKYVIPTHHFLESWGDAEIKPGLVSMMQPTISPLFKTRQFEDSLLKWSGNPTTYAAYFKNFWTTKLGSPDAYNTALQNGFAQAGGETGAGGGTFNAGSVATATAAISAMKAGTGKELVLYQNVAMGDGRQANNPWLLELPDPITKCTWENYVMISPILAKELFKIDVTKKRQADNYEVYPEKPEVKVTVGGKSISLPALIVPGMQKDTLAIAVGFGRKSKNPDDTALKIGRASASAGQNVFNLVSFNGTTTDFIAGAATIESTGKDLKVAITQSHNSYEGRHEVVKEITLKEFKANPTEILDERKKELEPWGGLEKYREDGTLYPNYDRPGVRWGMSIDLNACYGCGACVVACHAENNVPVVGKSEVMRGHEMHWLRIDRYFSGNPEDADSIQTVFQPMLCQHCDNAPCENVCPVAATNHNSEGINQMIYNRCIGTRYCANNCPYKVRRFNWLDYTTADSFPNNQDQTVVGKLDPAVFQMTDVLTRMVLNPDVTVRSRGVIEKCSFCVQRLQEGKLKAKKENRTLVDSDAVTACAQACAAGAITFSNINNSQSVVSKMRQDNPNRTFYVLEQIHTLPSINYMVKVRNSEMLSAHEELHEGAPEQATAAPKAHAE